MTPQTTLFLIESGHGHGYAPIQIRPPPPLPLRCQLSALNSSAYAEMPSALPPHPKPRLRTTNELTPISLSLLFFPQHYPHRRRPSLRVHRALRVPARMDLRLSRFGRHGHHLQALGVPLHRLALLDPGPARARRQLVAAEGRLAGHQRLARVGHPVPTRIEDWHRLAHDCPRARHPPLQGPL